MAVLKRMVCNMCLRKLLIAFIQPKTIKLYVLLVVD